MQNPHPPPPLPPRLHFHDQNAELPQAPVTKLRVRQNIALCAPPTDRNSAFLVGALAVRSTSFSFSPLQACSDMFHER